MKINKPFIVDRSNNIISITRSNPSTGISLNILYSFLKEEEKRKERINNRDEFIDKLLEDEE